MTLRAEILATLELGISRVTSKKCTYLRKLSKGKDSKIGNLFSGWLSHWESKILCWY